MRPALTQAPEHAPLDDGDGHARGRQPMRKRWSGLPVPMMIAS